MLVGKGPHQKRFTVYQDLLVQRSDFFKTARSSRWTEPDKPTTLGDHDPEVFSTYLHRLYFGAEAIKDRLSTITEPDNDDSDDDSSGDGSSDSDTPAADGAPNGDAEDSSSKDGSDSDTPENNERAMRQNIEKTPGAQQEVAKVLVDGKEKEATAILLLGNLSWKSTEKTVEQPFVEFGELQGVRIVTRRSEGFSTRFGYVEFTSAGNAAKALK